MDLPGAMPIDEILELEDQTGFAIALSNLVCRRAWSLGVGALSQAERVTYLVDELEREVNNGGFLQYFANSAGDWARETLEALLVIGAPLMAEVLERAMVAFPPPGPSDDRDVRGAQLEALGEEQHARFDPLDAEFCAYPENLTALLRAFVTEHHAEFGPPL